MDWMEERRGEERGIGGRDSSSISFLKGMRQNLPRSQSTNKRQELGCKSDSLVIFIPREQRKGGLLSSLLALFPPSSFYAGVVKSRLSFPFSSLPSPLPQSSELPSPLFFPFLLFYPHFSGIGGKSRDATATTGYPCLLSSYERGRGRRRV